MKSISVRPIMDKYNKFMDEKDAYKMGMCVCLPLCICFRVYVCLCVCYSVCLCATVSLFLFVCVYLRLSVFLAVCVPLCLSVCPCVCLSFYLSAFIFVCLSVCLSASGWDRVTSGQGFLTLFFRVFCIFLHVLGYFNTFKFWFFLSITRVTRGIYSVSFGIAEIIRQSDFHFFFQTWFFLIDKTM